MASVGSVYQPSVLQLARAGNFRAIAYWINTYLAPQGYRVRVDSVKHGCLQIRLDFQSLTDWEEFNFWRDRLVRAICHLVWKLNSDVIEGVTIVARTQSQPDILWKKSVRIVTPANQRKTNRAKGFSLATLRSANHYNFKVFRSFFLSGVAVLAFIVGSWFSYYDAVSQRSIASTTRTSATARKVARPAIAPEDRPDTVKAALETIPVVEHTQVLNPNDPTVTLMFGGDVTLSDNFADLVGKNHTWAFAEIPEYRDADLAMVNLENPLTSVTTMRPGKMFNFKAEPESVEVLKEGGVDIVNLANNHAMDYEAPGLKETLETLDQAGIHYIGAGKDIQHARRPEIIDVKGQRIAYLGYYNPDFHAAGANVAGTNPLLEAQIAEDIRAIRDQVDWIVVNYHWGVELADYPETWQVELAHFTIDQGADVVVGHHPHVLQGAEIYNGRPIAYSLGNFIFGGNSRSDYDTAVLKVSLRDQQMKVEFLPVEVRKYQPKVVKDERGDRILAHIQQISTIFGQPMQSPTIIDAPVTDEVETPEAEPTATQSTPEPVLPTFVPSPASSNQPDAGEEPAAPIMNEPLEPFTDENGDEAFEESPQPTDADPFNSSPFTAPSTNGPSTDSRTQGALPKHSTVSFSLLNKSVKQETLVAFGDRPTTKEIQLPKFAKSIPTEASRSLAMSN